MGKEMNQVVWTQRESKYMLENVMDIARKK